MSGQSDGVLDSDVLRDTEWQMHYGERFALEGLLRTVTPRLAIEIGRAEGGSLRRIAAHSERVHSFDLVPESERLRRDLANVEFHTGDSAIQVPEALAHLTETGEEVDFALIDGDHSAQGVNRDARAFLDADCCRRTVIVFHDAANDDVRAGLDDIGFEKHPKVALAMLDFVPGFVVEKGSYAMQIWNGLGLVVLAADRTEPPITEPWRFDSAALQRRVRDQLVAEREPQAPPAPSATTFRPEQVALLGGAAAALGAVAGWLLDRARRSG